MSLRNFFAWRKEKLVLTLLVKNEADIILDNVLFHYAKGVDQVIVTDNGSTDGTIDILKALQADGYIELLEAPVYKQAELVNRMGSIAKEKYGATILIHADADEFWNPTNGNNLKKTFYKSGQSAVLVDRKDVLPTPAQKDNTFPQAEQSIVTKHLISDNVEEDSKKTSMFLFRLPPKVMFSVKEGLKNVGVGNHNLATGEDTKVTEDIIIFHFPFKSTGRFEEKVVTAGKSMEKVKTSPETWWHWKRWYSEYKAGTLDEEVDILIPELETIKGIEHEPFDYQQRVVKPIRKNSKLWRWRQKHATMVNNLGSKEA